MSIYYPELLAQAVPRYTSYPTAAEFDERVGKAEMREALTAIAPGTRLSLYVHIPYCKEICWYCGCNTAAANKTSRLESYLTALEAEIMLTAKLLGGRGRLERIAFGGGSPNALAPVEFVRLVDRITTVYAAGKPEISVELDPRAFTNEWALTLAVAGVTRVSMGVQTFAPEIQAAIGRIQPLAMIENAMASLRARGINAINFDLMYGLPGQSLEDLDESLSHSIRLAPSRVALFGYAHLPQQIPRQRRIDATHLPDSAARFGLAELGHQRLTQAGYQAIGFDHFALPGDALAIAARAGRVHRNFQGFTEDDSSVLIGVGASAISQFPDRLIQNEKNPGRYRMILSSGQLPATRGVLRNAQDQHRNALIEALLCNGSALIEPASLAASARAQLAPLAELGLVAWVGDRLTITPAGAPYARLVAAAFDAYRPTATGSFSLAI